MAPREGGPPRRRRRRPRLVLVVVPVELLPLSEAPRALVLVRLGVDSIKLFNWIFKSVFTV